MRKAVRTLRSVSAACIVRCSAIEPAIGHMKMNGRLDRNPLKGALGDALHAMMCGARHNLRMILAALRRFCARFGLSMQAATAALIAVPSRTDLPAAESGIVQGGLLIAFLGWFISGSRSFEAFLVELGTIFSVASAAGPGFSNKPLCLSRPFTTRNMCHAKDTTFSGNQIVARRATSTN